MSLAAPVQCSGSKTPALDLMFHHVGVAVRDMDKALAYYTGALGMRVQSAPITVPSQKVRVCFLCDATGSSVLVELVEGLEAGSPVERMLNAQGGGPYHLCFQVRDLAAAVKRLRRQGFFPLTRFEAGAAEKTRFAFLLTPDRQLIELCEGTA